MNRRATKVTALFTAATIALAGFSTPAFAVTQAEVDAAQAELGELSFQRANADAAYQDSLNELNKTGEKIETTKKKITKTEKKLEKKKEILSDRVAADYKQGGVSLVSLVVSSSNFEELATNAYYVNKVVEQDVAAIDDVRTTQAELTAQRTELEKLYNDQEKQTQEKEEAAATFAQREADQSAYVDKLDEELKVQMAIDDQRRLAEQQAIAAEAVAAVEQGTDTSEPSQALVYNQEKEEEEEDKEAASQQQDNSSNSNDDANSDGNSNQNSDPEPEPEPEPEEVDETPTTTAGNNQDDGSDNSYDDSYSDVSTSNGSSLTAAQRSAIVSAGYSQLGLPYSHTNAVGVGWDCSGLVAYCYGCAGISVSAYSGDQIASIINTDTLQAGDVIGWLGNVPGGVYERHVAIYIGGGQILHANGTSVAVEALSQWSPYTNGGPLI